jgi:hypothetical protein
MFVLGTFILGPDRACKMLVQVRLWLNTVGSGFASLAWWAGPGSGLRA